MKARFLALAALVLGLASCQTEPEGLNVNVGGEQDVTVCVSLPETTRANSAEGAFVNVDLGDENDTKTIRYILKIYQKVGDEYKASTDRQVEYSDGKSVVFPVRLVPNRDYRFVVWADYVMSKDDTDLHYNTTDLANITLNDTPNNPWVAMDETRDAFTGYFDTAVEGKKYTGTSSISITLTRPFAKLRVITTDMKELGHLGIKPHNAVVTYTTQFHESFNAFNGQYGDETVSKTHTYTIADYADQTGANKVLFTDYFFADDSDVVKFVMNVNEANGALIKSNNFNTDIAVQRNYLTTISGNILTDGNNVTVTVEDAFDGEYENDFVDDANAAQSALDYAIANTTVYLKPGVDYGTLYLRPVAGASNTTTDCDYLVYRNEMLRKVENLTIVGAEGATVDAIKVVAGHIEGSTGYVVDIKNLVIDSVEFNDTCTNAPHDYAAPIFFDLSYTNVDGLTVKNCKLEGNNEKMNFVYIYDSGKKTNDNFTTAAKNIVITGNEVDGIARLCELRQTENVTITENTIKNTYLHGILLPVANGGTYSGNVTITNNIAEGIRERFVRMAGAGNAVVVIENNTIKNYLGADADYIKVTDGNNVTIENNTLESVGVQSTENLKAALEDAVEANQTEVVIDANNAVINLNYGLTKALVPAGTTVTIRNAVVEGRSYGNGANGTVIFEGCTFNNSGAYSIHFDNGNGNVIFKNCDLYGWNSFGASLTSVEFENCSLIGNGTYALIRSYVDLTLTNCVINTSNANHNDNYSEGVEAIAPATLTENNVTYVAENPEALKAALAAGKTNITLTAGNYELSGLNFAANDVTLKGVDKANVVLNLDKSIYLQNKSVTLENLTYNLNAGKAYDEHAFAFVHHATAFNLKNCNVNRLRLNVYEANIEDCTFTLNTSSGFDGYCIYYYGNANSTVNVKNSTFATAGKGICIYSEHAKAYNLNVDKCSFTSSDSATDKAAIQMHTEYSISGNVKITETTATGFANINGGLWNELNNSTKVATDMFDIWVDGTQVH